MKTLLTFILALFTAGASAAPNTNTITFDWLDFGYQVDSVTNKPVKITPLEYSTVGSFFIVKTPRIYTNTFAGQCVVTNMQAGSYRVELATALGSITTFTSTIPATATGGTNYEATQFVTNFATNSGSTRSYSITVSDLRYPSTAGSNILFFTNAGRVTIAGTVVTGTSPAVASNYLAVTKLDATNGTAYALTVSGLLNSTNMDAKISAASNTVHTALIATNTLLFTNIFSLNTAVNNNAGNVTSISNRVIQAEVTNAVQQTALAGLTNSIATKQLGSASLTNLSAQVNVATNIIGAGFGLTVSSNNAGTWTITGATTNYIATTNGMSRNLTNLGSAYSDQLVVTNLVVGTNPVPPLVTALTVNGNASVKRNIYVGESSAGAFAAVYTYACCNPTPVYIETSTDTSGTIPVGTLIFKRTDTGDLHALRMGGFTSEPGKAIQFTKTNGFLYLTSGDSTYANSTNRFSIHQVNSRGVTVTNSSTENVSITNGVVNATKGVILPASTPFTAPNSLGIQGAHLWSDGTNLCVVLQDSAGTRTTNKVTLTAWP